jgi:hypothetical protein
MTAMFAVLTFLSTSALNESLAKHDVPIDRLRHFECFNVVRLIDREVRGGKQVADITADLTGHCKKLSEARKKVCLDVISAHVPAIVAQITNKTRPDAVCDSIGFRRPLSGARSIGLDQCVKFVNLVREDGSDSKDSKNRLPKPFKTKTGAQGASTLHGRFDVNAACKSFAAEEKLSCHIITRLASKGFLNELQKDARSDAICHKLDEKRLIKLVKPNSGGDGAKQA